ncbi:hypothetical protein HZH66_010539 [Vespula vulgaris]|uniref:Uncharacterized protein n=1 Tax=Vespula vulgaris TaxID=7454 RepID=A0A834JH58_VESVU|nr:hypothetical protein HZH66_010539 [Vespula vulgaris]
MSSSPNTINNSGTKTFVKKKNRKERKKMWPLKNGTLDLLKIQSYDSRNDNNNNDNNDNNNNNNINNNNNNSNVR